MSLQLETHSNLYLFTGHGDHYVAINDQPMRPPVVVMAGELRTDWSATGFDTLTAAHFDYFLDLKPDVLLLGTGARQQFAHPSLYRTLTTAGIALECMNTPAACRTYNILAVEQRRVIAAILP